MSRGLTHEEGLKTLPEIARLAAELIGSGEDRTVIARIRDHLERQVPPPAGEVFQTFTTRRERPITGARRWGEGGGSIADVVGIRDRGVVFLDDDGDTFAVKLCRGRGGGWCVYIARFGGGLRRLRELHEAVVGREEPASSTEERRKEPKRAA